MLCLYNLSQLTELTQLMVDALLIEVYWKDDDLDLADLDLIQSFRLI